MSCIAFVDVLPGILQMPPFLHLGLHIADVNETFPNISGYIEISYDNTILGDKNI